MQKVPPQLTHWMTAARDWSLQQPPTKISEPLPHFCCLLKKLAFLAVSKVSPSTWPTRFQLYILCICHFFVLRHPKSKAVQVRASGTQIGALTVGYLHWSREHSMKRSRREVTFLCIRYKTCRWVEFRDEQFLKKTLRNGGSKVKTNTPPSSILSLCLGATPLVSRKRFHKIDYL